jgi:hypothetical protein
MTGVGNERSIFFFPLPSSFLLIEDREEGKYVGRIVDASDVDHFEI